jgi:hypothetical protein
VALTKKQINDRNAQIAAAQAQIRAGNSAAAQSIVNNLIGGASVGGAQAALQQAVNSIPAPPPPQAAPSIDDRINAGNSSGDLRAEPLRITQQSPGATYTPPPPSPTPPSDPWNRTNTFVDPRGIKQPDPSVILFDSGTISPEYLVELEYEDISGMELISMSRSDLIDGQSVTYSPIKNLSALRNKYNPNNIIAIPSESSSEFSKYRIDLILRGIISPYFDKDGNLVVEIEDMKQDELIEVQVDSSGTINLMDFS